ncbi:MAG: hypothetical protein AVDCRST_MAG93-3308 [uncultured Chloroflexia bacterium]|uniref:Uncharacterized protein n=1 Tax=uncultured Chloroflexia bacterium TaxID=1672391 RepID=A0A6J4JN19_9CHLR|nr:MAG: hypothetical protein AVDCRST_MAG93-3308 [uncultured Chloroflexia bacterium]
MVSESLFKKVGPLLHSGMVPSLSRDLQRLRVLLQGFVHSKVRYFMGCCLLGLWLFDFPANVPKIR